MAKNGKIKIESRSDHNDAFAVVGIEDVRGQVQLLVCKTDEQAGLDVAVGPMGAGALRDDAKAKPLGRPKG